MLFSGGFTTVDCMLRVALAMERKVENVNRVRMGRRGKKKRELLQCYPAEKVDKLCAALQAKNMYYWDPDFPNDEEELRIQAKFYK